MSKKIVVRMLSVIILCCSALICTNVYAVNYYDITFVCATSDSQIIMKNETFKIYQVADEHENINEDFSSIAKSDDVLEYAHALEKHVNENSNIKEYESFTSDETGKAEVNIPNGMYLVVGSVVTKDKMIYKPQPLLLNIDAKMYHELTSYVKYEEINPENVDTGDDIYSILMYCMASIAVAALIIVKRRKEAKNVS